MLEFSDIPDLVCDCERCLLLEFLSGFSNGEVSDEETIEDESKKE